MALTYNQITAITERHFIKKLVDGIYNSNAFTARLSRPDKLKKLDGGHQIIAPVIYSKPGEGGYYSDLDTLSADRTDNITSSVHDWKQLQEPIRISRLDLLKNSGDAAKLSLIASKMQIAEKNIRDNLGIGLFSDGTAGTGAGTTNQITGVDAVVSTTSTYGGIAVADFAEWVAYVDSNSGTNRALTLNLIQSLQGNLTEGNDKPTVHVCRQNVMDEVWSLFQPHQRLMSEEMEKLGFKGTLMVNDVPVIVDSHAAANTLYAFNEDYLYLAVHSKENFRKETFESLETTNSMLMRIFWAGNLICNNRRFQGKLSDVEVAS